MNKELLIETPSLLLRRFVPADTKKVFRMSQEESMKAWIPSQVYRDEAHAGSVVMFLISQYASGGDPRTVPIVLGVQLKATAELVGHIGLSPFNEAVEVGYAIEGVHQRKGFATEAVRAACAWATSEFPINTILGISAAQNVASQGVLLRAGFRREKEQIMPFQGAEQRVFIFQFSPYCAQPGAAPNGAATERGNSGASEGPPSAS
jgi:ribosomal-protein-alanine N-acetyltransferase